MGETPRRRPRAWSMQFVGLVALVLVLVTSTVALGEDPPAPVYPDEGLLILELGPDGNRFVWDKPAGADETQGISVTGCEAHLDTDGDVLVTVGTDPAPPKGQLGLFDDGTGVKTKGKGGNGQPCGRTDGPDEKIIVALAGSLADKEIVSAELDLEGKFLVEVQAELYLGTTLVAPPITFNTTDPDSGPDSGEGDNFYWYIDEGVLFDKIVLSVHSSTPDGAFSLHGGADWSTPGPELGVLGSAFKLTDVDGVVDCGDPTHTEAGSSTTPEVSFVRGANDISGDKDDILCGNKIGYSIDTSSNTTSQTAGFVFDESLFPSWFGTFTWAAEPLATAFSPTVVVEGATSGPLQWCDGFTGDTDPFTGDDIPKLPSGESWCLVSQTSWVVGSNLIQSSQTIYGLKDPSFVRPR